LHENPGIAPKEGYEEPVVVVHPTAVAKVQEQNKKICFVVRKYLEWTQDEADDLSFVQIQDSQ